MSSVSSSQMYGARHGPIPSTVPLHLLSHPRNSFTTQQLRHGSTFLGRRTYQSARLVRYYIGPATARRYQSEKMEFPKRLRSTRMRRRIDFIRRNLMESRRAFKSCSTARNHQGWTKLSVQDLRAESERVRQPLTHLDDTGAARMVEISGKTVTKRVATAVANLLFSDSRTYPSLISKQVVKGDAIAVARLAAIQGAKKTADLVPLAHPSLGITAVDVQVEPFGCPDKSFLYKCIQAGGRVSQVDAKHGGVTITATVKCEGKTGVEMEAITAATMGAVTMYDMLKGIDKGMVIMGTRVVRKEGGKSGNWQWDDEKSELKHDDIHRPPLIGESTKSSPQESGSQVTSLAGNETRPQDPSSDVDEWNQGLTDEFSVTEGIKEPSRMHEENLVDKVINKTSASPDTSNVPSLAGSVHSVLEDIYNKTPQTNTIQQNRVTPNTSMEHRLRKAASELDRFDHDNVAEILSSIKAIESRLLSLDKSHQRKHQRKHQRELELDTDLEWHPERMSPVRQEDITGGHENVNAKTLEKTTQKRYEKGESSGGGSVIK